MLEKEILYSLSDITIIPYSISNIRSRKECVTDIKDLTGKWRSLPIVTAPMDSVVGVENYGDFIMNDISPILPRTTPLDTRLSHSPEVFCAYGMAEIEDEFIKKDYPKDKDFYVLIDIANGHMRAQLDLGKELKSKYGEKIHLMGGNIANPVTALEYGKAGFEYLRVGIGGGQGCITSTQSGVHYPMASLLSDTLNHLRSHCFTSLKIIADGGIRTYSDVIKCLALGADYVMMGYTLSKSLEASGDLYSEDGKKLIIPDARRLFSSGQGVYKEYHGMSTKATQKMMGGDPKKLKTSEGRTERVKIEYTLPGWTENFQDYLRSAMSYVGARDLSEFREKAVCKLLSPEASKKLDK